jgi:hypothetical protein
MTCWTPALPVVIATPFGDNAIDHDLRVTDRQPAGQKGGSVVAMTTDGEVGVLDELRFLADSLRRIDAAVAAAEWDDDSALTAVVAAARAEAALVRDGMVEDIAATRASARWLERARYQAGARCLEDKVPGTPAQAEADAVVAVALARAAVAEAVLAVARAHHIQAAEAGRGAVRRSAILRADSLAQLGRRFVGELRHVFADQPRKILLRLAISLAISLAMVTGYHFIGVARYDDFGQLTLYLFAAVVGSVVCTNALCFEAQRVRDGLSRGERMWRILVAKNLAMAALIIIAAVGQVHGSVEARRR